MVKKVNYKEKTYKISLAEYGFDSSRLLVNGEATKHIILNSKLNNIKEFSRQAKLAINDYIDKQTAAENFKKWDGTIK